MFKRLAIVLFVFGVLVPHGAFAQGGDPGCQAATLVSTGGAFPRDPATLAIRWTGYSNFELAYKGQTLLLDAYFDRGSLYPPLGFRAADVTRADVMLIGHGHADHMSDAASVGARTGAILVGAPVTTEKLLTQSIGPGQLRTVTGRGGELLTFTNFTVQPILARHGEPPADITAAFNQALRSTAPQPTPQQLAEQAEIRQRGTSDPRVLAEGTIAYLITLDTGFRILFRDSGGTITGYEKAAMQQAGRVDILLGAVSAAVLPYLTAERALEYARTYKPDAYIAAHHDAPTNDLWRATEPIFQALKDANPGMATISKGYREPSCFDVSRKTGSR